MFLQGRPAVIPDEIKSLMFNHISAELEQGRPVSSETILDWTYAGHHLSVLPDMLRDMIRRTAAFKTVHGIPIEAKRCCVTVEAIDEHFVRLSQELEPVSVGFISNVNESRFQGFVGFREIQVVVPASYERDMIEIPANRSEKRSTMLAVVSADSSYLKPMAIIQRKTDEIGPFDAVFTPDKAMIVHRERGFIAERSSRCGHESCCSPKSKGGAHFR
jgi:hypothetical protein